MKVRSYRWESVHEAYITHFDNHTSSAELTKIIKNSSPLSSLLWLAMFFTMIDISNFFLKEIIWIPEFNWVLLIRTLIWILCGMYLTEEFYEHAKRGKSLFMLSWLCHMNLFLEGTCVWKMSETLFQNVEIDLRLKYMWYSVGVSLLIVLYKVRK